MKKIMIVLGDVHGNYEALKGAVEDALKKYTIEYNGKTISAITGFVFMGDYGCDFPQGQKCIDYIREIANNYPTYVIKGNRETGMVDKYYEAKKNNTDIGWSLDTTMGAPLIDCSQMSEENLEYIYNLPTEMVIEFPGESPVLITHRFPLTENGKKLMEEKNIKNIIFAHTHAPYDQTFHDSKVKLYNPGSVGLTECGVPGADYGVLESNHSLESGYTFTLNHVDYDYGKAIENLEEYPELFNQSKGWGYSLKYSIETGVNCTVLYVFEKNRISQFAAENTDKSVDEIIRLYEEKYPEINYSTSRDYLYDEEGNQLKERMFMIKDNEVSVKYFDYIEDVVKPGVQEDWMFELALRRLDDFVQKYKENMKYVVNNDLMDKTR